ncbi:MBL fold metallo-hydrolase [Aneurinibacillus sp. REN35]|uniref:MBL fold metallo-hydrolase n=1 Tax=Aneurinibacillus sp. REN35 TaxID=3237286 RepID=UPI0035292C65
MSRAERLGTNVEGDFYVNAACINCDTCRQLAPSVFSQVGRYSAVTCQPEDQDEKRRAFHALLACPTGAIGSEDKEGLKDAIEEFPLHLADQIYYCGYTSRESFGASSYFLVHPDGNWLIDAPRYVPSLAKKLGEMGGVRYVFLTHQDDVADAEQYARHFGAERIIHEAEKDAQPEAEHIIKGKEPIEWQPGFEIIPVPGHTAGHIVLLYKDRFLFSGDHLSWNRDTQKLDAHKEHCWYSWRRQSESMVRLAEEAFEWVLPGHGNRIHLPQAEMRDAMQALIHEMKV